MNDMPDNDNPEESETPAPIIPRRSLAARLRNYFLTGVIVTAAAGGFGRLHYFESQGVQFTRLDQLHRSP